MPQNSHDGDKMETNSDEPSDGKDAEERGLSLAKPFKYIFSKLAFKNEEMDEVDAGIY